jgi:regulator of sirC expression with transglutaminase-like and TPR domain
VLSLSAQQARERFTEIISLDDEEMDLAEAVLLIAAEEYPHLDIQSYIDKLDYFGDLARERAGGTHDVRELIGALNSTLFEKLGFHGCRDSYYDPRNSFLNQVIDRRTGVPITLSVIYMEVARRIDVAVLGVGLPYHFVVEVPTVTEEIFIDPFNEGRLMTRDDCVQLVKNISHGREALTPDEIDIVDNERIIGRILLNLLGLYKANDPRRAVAALDRLLLIVPHHGPYQRMRGLLLAKLGDHKNAIAQLESYLEVNPEAEDADEIHEQIKKIRLSLVRLN